MDKLSHALKILKRLNQSSFEAFIVGGAVRDYLLDLPLQDIDITTNAKPEDVASIFDKTIPTGAAFGTMTVIEDGLKVEVTTYRQDGRYLNHRKPASITYANDVQADLMRRDFTINQLRMDADKKIYDDYHGKADLQNKIIRTIGPPEERFEEDALRLLRAFRFSAKLGFTIEEKTLQAIKTKASLIQTISIERIQQELARMLEYDKVLPTVAMICETTLADHLYNLKPGLLNLLNYNEGSKYKRLFLVSRKTDLQLAPWRLPKQTLKRLYTLDQLSHQLHQGFFPRLLLEYAIQDFQVLDEITVDEGHPSSMKTYYDTQKNLVIASKKDLAISGKDIDDAFDFEDKSMIQVILDTLIDQVLARQLPNQKEALLGYAKNYQKWDYAF